ncbi:MAG: CARDB domain-containing protein, partial [Candidatus Bathyarchaeales archaeon]
MSRNKFSVERMFSLILLLMLLVSLYSVIINVPYVSAQPAWPESWIQIDWDKNENGPKDDWRDVEYAYYQYDADYLYLKLQCYAMPGSEWPAGKGRYKWFIDLDGDMYYSGENIFDAEYLLFVEDTDDDGNGEMYLLYTASHSFDEYEPWPPTNYADYLISDPSIGGWRINGYQIEMYISWASIGSPPSYWLGHATDQENPNLDQGPTTDHVDEKEPLAVHNVAAIGQTPTPTVVKQGEPVTIEVVLENKGTQAETFNVTCYFNNSVIGTQLVSDLAAGHQATLIFVWDTTGVSIGNYLIKAWADSSAAIVESDEEDNWCTSPAMVTVQPPPVHDVAAISQVPDKTSVVQGIMVNVNVTVANLGDFIETFNVTCFYGNNPIGYETVTDLAAKTSTSMIFAWDTTGVEPGTYYVWAMADSSNVIAEVDEENNNCTSLEVVTVYSPEQMGKLFVDKVKTAVISGEDPPVVGYSTVYEFTIIVTNVGGSDVSGVVVNETISSDVTFVSVGTPSQGSVAAVPPPKIVWDVGTLAPGAEATLTFRVSVTPASSGLLYLNHKEDIVASGTDTLLGGAVADSGDTDVTVTAIIRDVAAVSQVPSSAIVCQGDTIAIEVTVKNFGDVSESFDVACYYDENLIGVLRVYNLDAGGETTISFAWDTTGIVPGTYSIRAEADSSDEIAESDETNNVCLSPSAVEIVIHDIATLSQTPSPTEVVQGEVVTIAVVVKNEGTEPETFTVSCYYNDTLLETKTVTNLEPSTTLTLEFLWDTTGVPAGEYFINAAASTVLGEKDTDDNACLSTISVTVTLPQYSLTITTTTGGTTDPIPGTYTYVAGSTVEVTAIPDTDYTFDHWELDGIDVGSANPYSVLMDADHVLHAV